WLLPIAISQKGSHGDQSRIDDVELRRQRHSTPIARRVAASTTSERDRARERSELERRKSRSEAREINAIEARCKDHESRATGRPTSPAGSGRCSHLGGGALAGLSRW